MTIIKWEWIILRNLPFKTIIVLVLITVLALGYHTYVHLNIDRERFDNTWGYEKEVSFSEMNAEPLAGEYNDNLLLVSFEESGNLLYKIISKKGEIVKEGSENLDKFNKNKIGTVKLLGEEIFFIENSNLYKIIFNENDGFSDKIMIKSNIDGFNIIDGKNFTLYNSEEVYSYDYLDNKFTEKDYFKLENSNIIDAFILNKNGNSIIITYRKISTEEVNISYNIANFDSETVEIGNIKSVYNIYKGKTQNTYNEGIITISSNFKEYGQQGSETLKKLIYSINLKNQELIFSRLINSNNFKEINNFEEIIDLETIDNEVYLIGSGFNDENKYVSRNDIFITKINSSGEFYDTSFISNTFKHSQNPVLIEIDENSYAFWMEVEGNGYKIMYNSDNDEFLEASSKIKSSEVQDAFLKALSGPFFAVSMLLIKSSIMIVLFFAILGVAYMIMYNKDLYKENDEKIRKIILIGLFVIINLISFKFNYIEGTRLSQTPDYLIRGLSFIYIPLIINFISIFAFYVFDREKKEVGLLWKIIFLLIVDAYIANLIYTPFIMINKILI